MTLALAITDNADGTGSVATITGSAGASNSVYYSLFNGGGEVTSYGWTLGGTRVGDGTVSLALPVGYYWYMLVSGVGAFNPANSVSVYGAVTNASVSEAHIQILNAVVARINQLSLLSSQYVVKKWAPRYSDPELTKILNTTPLIIVSPNGVEEDRGGVTSEDDIGLPVLVSIAFSQNHDSVANMETMLSWRNRIARSLRWQRLTVQSGQASKQIAARPKPGPIVDPQAWLDNQLVSHYWFFYDVRQTRGLT